MISNLAGLRHLNFRDIYGLSRLDNQGEEHWPRLDMLIREQPGTSLVAFDLRGLEYLGYSYAKPTIRRVLLQRNKGEYGERRMFLVADQGPKFLDGIEAALREKELFMLVAPSLDRPVEAGWLIGLIPDYVRATFDVLRSQAPIPTGKLAEAIGQSPQNTKNRLDRLQNMGLLRREKIPSPSGGLEWLNQIF